MAIHFINPGGSYSHLLNRIIWPIAAALPQEVGASIGPSHDLTRFNVHFFREDLDTFGNPRQCCDLHLSHGFMQKLFEPTPERLKKFAFLGVPGPTVRDCLVEHGIPAGQIVIAGHPGMDDEFRRQKAFADGHLKEFYGQHVIRDARLAAKNPKPIVVWAPSHSAFLGEYVKPPVVFTRALEEEFTIIKTEHPARSISPVLTRELFHYAKAVVGDISGTIFEAWAMGLPVIFPDWLIGEYVETYCGGMPLGRIYSEGIGRHVMTPEDFPDAVREAVAEGITEREQQFVDEYFPPDLRGTSGLAVAQFLQGVRRVWIAG